MFKNVSIKVENATGYAWFHAVNNGETATEEQWDAFKKFGNIENVIISALDMHDPVLLEGSAWITREQEFVSLILEAIERCGTSTLDLILGVIEEYYQIIKTKHLQCNLDLLLSICRAADVFMNAANCESVNKLKLCINDAYNWCSSRTRATAAFIYKVDPRENFDEPYDPNTIYYYNKDGRCNREDREVVEIPKIEKPRQFWVESSQVFVAFKEYECINIVTIQYDKNAEKYCTMRYRMFNNITEPNYGWFIGVTFDEYDDAKEFIEQEFIGQELIYRNQDLEIMPTVYSTKYLYNVIESFANEEETAEGRNNIMAQGAIIIKAVEENGLKGF